MKKILTPFFFFYLLIQTNAFPQSANLVISQVFGGAGCSVNTPVCNTPYTRDYIELFNRGTQPVNIGGYSLQAYDGVSWEYLIIFSNQVINPGQYFSIAGIAQTGNINAVEPNVDAYGSFSLAWNSNNIALVNNTTLLSNCPASYNNVIDKLGYGISPACWEGPIPGAGPIFFDYALYRKNGGCQDNNQNSNDFETGPAVPRNLLTATNNCPIPPFPALIPSPAEIDGLVATMTEPSDSVYLEIAGHNLVPSGNPTELLNITPSPGIEVCYDAGTGFDGIFYPGPVDWPYGGPEWTFRFLVRLSAGSVASPYFTGYVTFTGGGASVTVPINAFVVPVKLSKFEVKKQNSIVQLYWTTEQEISSKQFIVERSLNQNKWDEIASVNAAGNSSEKINYSTTDINPAKGINYYRLKEVDVDGRFSYSEIRSVYFGNDENIVLAPNPTKDKVTLFLPANSKQVVVKIYNSNGQLIQHASTAEELLKINVSLFSKGVYTIKITGEHLNEVKRLLVE